MRRRNPVGPQSGQALVWVAALLLLVGAVAAVVVRAGRGASQEARAEAVADLVALAGASGGRPAAERVAAANGASLRSFRGDDDGRVRVEVEWSGRRATAAARVELSPAGAGGP